MPGTESYRHGPKGQSVRPYNMQSEDTVFLFRTRHKPEISEYVSWRRQSMTVAVTRITMFASVADARQPPTLDKGPPACQAWPGSIFVLAAGFSVVSAEQFWPQGRTCLAILSAVAEGRAVSVMAAGFP